MNASFRRTAPTGAVGSRLFSSLSHTMIIMPTVINSGKNAAIIAPDVPAAPSADVNRLSIDNTFKHLLIGGSF